MAGQGHNGMRCGEFDTLLSHAIDGTLAGERLQAFEDHGRECGICGPLLQEAVAGRDWLKSLEEVEPPAMLVTNILLKTSGVAPGKVGEKLPFGERLLGWITAVVVPVFTVVRQPRFAMSFGMAFFTLSVTLSIAGVRLRDIRHLDLRPTAVRHTYYETQGRVVKYYENIRFVYEIQARVRQFKQAVPATEHPAPQENRRKDNSKKDSSGPPERQERNYSSQEGAQPVMASLPDNGDFQRAIVQRDGVVDSPVVPGTTNRRFV